MKLSNPSLLVAELKAQGFTLSAHGGKLKAGPADLLTDELRQSIRENRAEIIRILAANPESYPSTTPAEKMRYRANMTPSRVTCGACSRFLPDTINPAQGVGRCSVTGTGPPDGGSGYRACFPLAPRTCPSHEQKDPET